MPDQPTNDEIADQFDQAWQEDRPALEEFLQRQYEREHAALLELLLPIDIEYRKRAGENVNAEDYRDVSTNAVDVARHVMEQASIDLTREPRSGEASVDLGATIGPATQQGQSLSVASHRSVQTAAEDWRGRDGFGLDGRTGETSPSSSSRQTD